MKGKITMLTPNLPESDHGTHVAGLIAAANNDKGIRGVADQAEIFRN
ncbi:MAG: S8 family serine peptidase [Blautia sp.]